MHLAYALVSFAGRLGARGEKRFVGICGNELRSAIIDQHVATAEAFD